MIDQIAALERVRQLISEAYKRCQIETPRAGDIDFMDGLSVAALIIMQEIRRLQEEAT